MTPQRIPGTDLLVVDFAHRLHQRRKAEGYWDADPSMPESHIRIIEELSQASACYLKEAVLPPGFHREGAFSPKTAPCDGFVLIQLAWAVLLLLDLAARYSTRPLIWDGMTRDSPSFYSDLHSIMGRILRLKADYPFEAIPMIERLAATWVSRAEFWMLIVELGGVEL